MDKKKIMQELKELLLNQYSGLIQKIILFGSQAMNNAGEYSDYDILVITKNKFNWKLKDAVLASCYEIDLKYNILTDVKLIAMEELKTIKGKQPFIQDALSLGIAL
ncbi:MAG: nucleotidyltransferase domain-containing protein [Acidobacteria bacterium]|nr:nucleotidyltransferase domain-containing protein [Acidobacteriota bacterium]